MAMTVEMIEKTLAAAKQAGASAADAMFVSSAEVSVSQRLGKPEEMQRAEEEGVGLRVFVGQKIATACSSDFSDEALQTMAEKAVAMAREGIDDPYAALATAEQLAVDVPDLQLKDPSEESDIGWMREQCAQTEDSAMAHAGITNSEGAEMGVGSHRVTLGSSNGFMGHYASSYHSLSACVLAGEGEGMQRDYAYSTARYREDLRVAKAIGDEAAERTLRRLKPQKVKTSQVPVVFDPRIGKRMVSSFCGAINGAAIARGTSFLKDRMGEPLFDSAISIIDDPRRLRGLGSKPFDGEGLPTQKLELVKDGVLQHWLLDVRSAQQLGLQSNGRAARGLSGSPNPSTTNAFIPAGSITKEALMADIPSGLYVTDAFGGGANIITGDFSLGVSGLWIEGGKLAHPVSEVTIAGTLLDMYKYLRTADDLVFDSATCVATLRIDGMTVAGS